MRSFQTLAVLAILVATVPAAQADVSLDRLIEITVPNPPLLPPVPLPAVLDSVGKAIDFDCNLQTTGPQGGVQCFGLCVMEWDSSGIVPGYAAGNDEVWVKTSGAGRSTPGSPWYLGAGYGGGTYTNGYGC
ncbi:MAG: hypothetical protein QOG31_58 [Thermoplasmata archaeon]|jgi:hypothetical protein|nr:hypothetical protein [Thermoplasmata archaeon]